MYPKRPLLFKRFMPFSIKGMAKSIFPFLLERYVFFMYEAIEGNATL